MNTTAAQALAHKANSPPSSGPTAEDRAKAASIVEAIFGEGARTPTPEGVLDILLKGKRPRAVKYYRAALKEMQGFMRAPSILDAVDALIHAGFEGREGCLPGS